ncbi:MAG: alpha/beta hydrolase [Gammaproteobacteria bacterium]
MSRVTVARKKQFLAGPAGRLEALLEYPRHTRPVATAVVCHPHPQYEGSMNNKVAYTLARAAVEAGAAALRFNFRGVGESDGEWGQGRGELADFFAAERWLEERHRADGPALPRWRLGFSFGAAIVIAASLETPCARLVTVAPPADHFDDYGLDTKAEPRRRQWLLVQGTNDEVVPAEAVMSWARALEDPPEIAAFDGVGHYFHGQLTELRARVIASLAQHEGKEDR